MYLFKYSLILLCLYTLASCSQPVTTQPTNFLNTSQKLVWKKITTWPKNFPGLGTDANKLAELITTMSNGRLTVKVYGANELVSAFEVFDAVVTGTLQIGHGAAYYWKGKHSASQFFTTIPFGINAQEINAWLYYGGGLELWQKLYKPFGLIPFPAGNTGVQMAGWFNKEIKTIADFKGLKIRLLGLGGEVLHQLGTPYWSLYSVVSYLPHYKQA